MPTGLKVTGTVRSTFRRVINLGPAERWVLLEEDGTGQVFEGAAAWTRRL